MMTALVPAEIGGVSSGELDLVRRLLARIDHHGTRNVLRDQLHDGKRAVQMLGHQIPAKYSRSAHIIGWPAKAVDLLALRAPLAGVEDTTDENDPLGVRKVLRDNTLQAEMQSAITAMLVHGVVFLVASKGGPGEPAGLIHTVDARSGTGDWNARTRRLDNFLSIHGRDDQRRLVSFTLYAAGQVVTAAKDGQKWDVNRSAYRGPVPVEALRFQPRPGRPFGASRITRPLIGLTEAAMRVAVRMEGSADVYSIPQLLALGAGAKDFEGVDGEAAGAWALALGNLLGLPDDDEAANPRATVQQIAASSPQPHIDQLRQYAQLVSGETSIPVTSLGVSDMSNPTSADSYIASREDLIATAEAMTAGISPAVERIVARAVAYAHGEPVVPDEWDLVAHWRNAAHISEAASADAGMKRLTAAPWLADTPIVGELLGLTADQQRRIEEYQRRSKAGALIDRILAEAPSGEADAEG